MADILFIRGAEKPDQIAQSNSILDELGFYMQRAGHAFTMIGNSTDGSNPDQIISGLEITKANIVMCWAHGDERLIWGERNQATGHVIQLGNSSAWFHVWASDLYQNIAQAAHQKPLDVFMFSCSAFDVKSVANLPAQSTYVTFTNKVTGDLYFPEAVSFAVHQRKTKPLGQDFLFSFMNRGYFEDLRFHPQIIVNEAKPRVFDLWHMACEEHLQGFTPNKGFSDTAKARVRGMLAGHFHKTTIDEALRSIETFRYADVHRTETIKASGTPIEIKLTPDREAFETAARKEQLFGAICSVAYCLSDAADLAFKASKSLPYTLPPPSTVPGRRLDDLSS